MFVFNGTFKLDKITPEVFLAPRGLITILLFYSIPNGILPEGQLGFVKGVLLFIILFSCLIMAWSLVGEKKKLALEEEAALLEDGSLEQEDVDASENEDGPIL